MPWCRTVLEVVLVLRVCWTASPSSHSDSACVSTSVVLDGLTRLFAFDSHGREWMLWWWSSNGNYSRTSTVRLLKQLPVHAEFLNWGSPFQRTYLLLVAPRSRDGHTPAKIHHLYHIQSHVLASRMKDGHQQMSLCCRLVNLKNLYQSIQLLYE